MAFFGLITLLIPLGLGVAALFAGILAHRGQATVGTWTLLISSAVYLLSVVGMGFGQFFFFSSIGPTSSGLDLDWEVYEIVMMVVTTLLILSLFAYSIGILLMGLQWGAISKENADLEKLAQDLALARDPVPSASPSNP